MGDRCMMRVFCRDQDQKIFEDLGFQLDEKDGFEVEMLDEERNYADMDGFPTNIPYWGYHSEGVDYGGIGFACDGVTSETVNTGHNTDGYVVSWDKETDNVSAEDIERIRRYHAILKRAMLLTKAEPLVAAVAQARQKAGIK